MNVAATPTNDPGTNINPYSMHTYAMPPNTVGPSMMGPMTHSPLNAMQNMYGNIQQQQLTQHVPLQTMAYPNTTQNVSVDVFKPATITQHHVAPALTQPHAATP